jgi:hypothetical protein
LRRCAFSKRTLGIVTKKRAKSESAQSVIKPKRTHYGASGRAECDLSREILQLNGSSPRQYPRANQPRKDITNVSNWRLSCEAHDPKQEVVQREAAGSWVAARVQLRCQSPQSRPGTVGSRGRVASTPSSTCRSALGSGKDLEARAKQLRGQHALPSKKHLFAHLSEKNARGKLRKRE